jgi:hypothetical protein
MIDLERDLQITEAMAADLKPYFLSNTLYWSLGSGGYLFPKGTLGGLLIRLHRLDALSGSLSLDQKHRLQNAQAQTRHQIDQWVVQAEEKALREIKARLRSWGEFVAECEENPRRYEDEYHTQVEGRTILEFLLDLAGKAINGQGVTRKLLLLDQRLRKIGEEGPFVWDEALIPAFPQETYWWLYLRFKQNNHT